VDRSRRKPLFRQGMPPQTGAGGSKKNLEPARTATGRHTHVVAKLARLSAGFGRRLPPGSSAKCYDSGSVNVPVYDESTAGAVRGADAGIFELTPHTQSATPRVRRRGRSGEGRPGLRAGPPVGVVCHCRRRSISRTSSRLSPNILMIERALLPSAARSWTTVARPRFIAA
jgi:hypothetical protein